MRVHNSILNVIIILALLLGSGAMDERSMSMPAIRHDAILLRLIKDVNYIRSILNRVTVNLPLFDVANENTPDQLTEDQNNYVIGNYDLLRLTSSQAVSITGLRGGIKGRFLRMFNIGNYPITLEYQDASSDPENRFKFSNGQAAVIPPSSNVTIYYDATEERWIGGDTYSSGAVYLEIENTNFQAVADSTVVKVDPGTVILDQYGFYDDANNQVVIQFDGSYHFVVTCVWDGDPNGYRQLTYYLNAAQTAVYTEVLPYAAHGAAQEVNYVKTLSAGDIVDVRVYQNSGIASGLLRLRLSMVKVA